MKEYIVNIKFAFKEQVEVKATDRDEAIEVAKQKIGRNVSEYEEVEYDVERIN